MWRSKKFIIIAALAAVVLVGSIGGIALAQSENGDSSQTEAAVSTLWDKAAAILQNEGVNVTSEQLKEAFSQAQTELRNDALYNYLQSLVKDNKITQQQADDYFNWWTARPDVPAGLGFRGRGGFRGIGGMRGWGGICIPAQ